MKEVAKIVVVILAQFLVEEVVQILVWILAKQPAQAQLIKYQHKFSL